MPSRIFFNGQHVDVQESVQDFKLEVQSTDGGRNCFAELTSISGKTIHIAISNVTIVEPLIEQEPDTP